MTVTCCKVKKKRFITSRKDSCISTHYKSDLIQDYKPKTETLVQFSKISYLMSKISCVSQSSAI